MTTFGTVGEFQVESGDWVQYTERLEHFFAANDIANVEKKRAILLSVCGGQTYRLISSLLAPEKPGQVDYSTIIATVTNHKVPKPSEIVQRFKFNSRQRKSGESVSDYVAQLRHLAEHCNFGTNLKEMLRDRLVCGVNDDRIQRRLLAEVALDFDKALSLATAIETADRNTADLREGKQPGSETVNKVREPRSGRNQRGPRSKDASCFRCGRAMHTESEECPAKREECYKCGKKGHFSRVCRSSKKADQGKDKGKKYMSRSAKERSQKSHHLEEEEEVYTLYHTTKENKTSEPFTVDINVKGEVVAMEIDTGSGVTIISEETWKKTWKGGEKLKLRDSRVKLRTYNKGKIEVMGECIVPVSHNNQTASLRLLVAKGAGPSLLGRDWMKVIRLDWQEVFSVIEDRLSSLLSSHSEVFNKELGTLKDVEVDIDIDPAIKPKFLKARPVPLARRDRVNQEIDRLLGQKILEPVQYSKWAAPIVPIDKPDGTIRICGDYRLTVNSAARSDTYPIPRIDELFTKLVNGKKFTKLDMSHAYQQLVLSPDSRELVTINTHRGLFQYTRMPFGISTAPAVFQRTMDNLLAGIPGVAVYLDDLLVTGSSEAEHLNNLEQVLKRLKNAGLRLKREKCEFLVKEVKYLGHMVSAEGLQPTEDRVRAITEMAAPTNIKELRAFLGMLNYYGKFMQNLSTVLEPLHRLLRNTSHWQWGKEQKAAFQRAKESLKSAKILTHYDSTKQLVLSCDASPYGVGAVLSHVMEDGSERPIGYTSRSLNSAERNYSQLDKEGLAIVFGVKKFHTYLYGRRFKIITDHKPLLGLFGNNKAIPLMVSPRVIRWSLILAAYEYEIVYKPGSENANADALSRLPRKATAKQPPVPEEIVLLMSELEKTPTTPSRVRAMTQRDPILARVRNYTMTGWPDNPGEMKKEMNPYYIRKNELSVHEGCVLWGGRVVLPPQCREHMIEEIHEAHPGIVKMKAIARSHVWWPQIDKDLEQKVRACPQCQEHQRNPPKAPLHSWEHPSQPWSRVHVDYAGPVQGDMLLILVDAYSKWIEVQVTRESTSSITIDKLRHVFSTHGIPHTLVSDNGPCFASEKFSAFMKANGIRHVKSAPYHPATNGLAERAVQTVKAALRKMSGPLQTRVARFLLSYRSTPHSVTLQTPAEMLMKRKLRTRVNMAIPDNKATVEKNQLSQKLHHDSRPIREFSEGDDVVARNYAKGKKWVPGRITRKLGPVSYEVEVRIGTSSYIWKRHADQILKRETPNRENITANGNESQEERNLDFDTPTQIEGSNPLEDNNHSESSEEASDASRVSERKEYPKRNVKKPDYYGY
ncbi:uncharacterized protein K02A2.6-like [Lytechinus pictus]|uniref:uncharacterized protein K02A2.6-like n=1 Tax=Lytechinus pictus TaxID=7653 RepID=UPI0030B9FE20